RARRPRPRNGGSAPSGSPRNVSLALVSPNRGRTMALADKQVPDNFHALYEPAVRAARGVPPTIAVEGAPPPGMERLAADAGKSTVHRDEATGLPVSITLPA